MHAATGFSKLAFEVTISDKVGSILPGSGWVGCSNTDTLQTLRLALFRAAPLWLLDLLLGMAHSHVRIQVHSETTGL